MTDREPEPGWAAPSPGGAPSPFSREGSRPEDSFRVGPPAVPAPVWPPVPLGPQGEPGYPEARPTNRYAAAPQAGGYGYGLAEFPEQHPQALPALVTGLLGLTLLPPAGVVGLILGLKVRREIATEPGRYSGAGLATAGLVTGLLATVLTLGYVILFVLFETHSGPTS